MEIRDLLHSQEHGRRARDPVRRIGDDPSVAADYDGDGRTDYAVYRQGASVGSQSYWWIRRSLDDGIVAQGWGSRGDTVAPGDYDGDGKADIAVRRAAGGLSVFYVLKSTGGSIVFQWGLDSDVIAPGDYDGDGKTDFAVVRDVGGQIVWYIGGTRRARSGPARSGCHRSTCQPRATTTAMEKPTSRCGADLHAGCERLLGPAIERRHGVLVIRHDRRHGDRQCWSASVGAGIGAVIFNDDFGGKALFPATNWWNQNISQAPLDARPMRSSTTSAPRAGCTRTSGRRRTAFRYVSVGGSQPRVPITWILDGHQSDNGFGGEIGYPIPVEARTQAGYIEGNVPAAAAAATATC